MKKEALININIQKKHFYILLTIILLFAAAGFTYALNIDPAVFGHADNGPIHIVGGNVGIGTTTPVAKLEVQGKIAVSRSSSSLERRDMYFWTALGSSGTSCAIACGDGYCIGGYSDTDENLKKACSVTTPSKNCICLGRP